MLQNTRKSFTRYNTAPGFTLIELIIVVSVILVIVGITLANYNNFSEQKKLDQDAAGLVDVLEMAKKRTMAGDDKCSSGPFNGYYLNVTSNSYELKICCHSTNCLSQNQSIKIYNLQSTNNSSASLIYFAPLTGHLYNNATITIIIENKIINKCKRIIISEDGVIEEGASQYVCP